MSVKVSALCWQIPLSSLEKLVLVRLADFADRSGGSIYPAVATIAHDCGMSSRQVQYILRKFIDDGLLVVLGNEKGGRGRTRVYAIDLDRAGQLAGPKGPSNGTGERVQTPQEPCTLSDPPATAERVQRVHQDAEKGAKLVHPTRQESVSKKESPVPPVDSDSVRGRAEALAGVIAGMTTVPATDKNRATVERWLRRGLDPDLDILPGVRDVLATTRYSLDQIRGFAFFADGVENRHARRTGPPIDPPPNVHPLRPGRPRESGAQQIVDLYAAMKAGLPS